MKKLIFLFALFNLTFMSAMANDVPQDPKWVLIQVHQVSQVLDVINADFIGSHNFQIANFNQVIYQVQDVRMSPLTTTSPSYSFIDPGIYVQVSVNKNVRLYNHNYSYTPYLMLTTYYPLPTTNYQLPTVDTARHVSFS